MSKTGDPCLGGLALRHIINDPQNVLRVITFIEE